VDIAHERKSHNLLLKKWCHKLGQQRAMTLKTKLKQQPTIHKKQSFSKQRNKKQSAALRNTKNAEQKA